MDVTGTYETNNGELTISKNGDKYSGTYAQNGVISGKLSENKLEGQWNNNGLEGLFSFEFSEDGSFSGNFKKGLDPGSLRGKWTGKLIGVSPSNENVKITVTEYAEISDFFEGGVLVKRISEGKDWKITSVGEFTQSPYDSEDYYLKKGRVDYWYAPDYEFTEEQIRYAYEEGEFDEDFFLRGTLAHLDGTIEEGEFWEGWALKKGKRTYSDGTIMEGDFTIEDEEFPSDSDYRGTLSKPNGTIYKGRFENGEFAEGEVVSCLGFTPGDVVSLKSGGIQMTIEKLGSKADKALCFYVYRGKITKEWFSLDMLKHVSN